VNVIFYHIGDDVSMPRMLAKSIIKHGHNPVFLTDKLTEDIEDCETHRFDFNGENLVWHRMLCYAEYNQPGIYLDSDMLVMHDLEPVMALDFDVALTKVSHDIIDPNGTNISALMPYNGGFIAVKNDTFLPSMVKHVVDTQNEAGLDLTKYWYCDQMTLAEVAKTVNLVELPVKIYNKTVKKPGMDVSGAWVLHFKGRGKGLMNGYQ
jgi:hypothetical protein